MQFRLSFIRNTLDEILPSKTIHFYPTKSKLFFVLLLLMIASIIIYYRTIEKDELELLRKEHKNIQLSIGSYLKEMSGIDINSENGKFLISKMNEYRNKLLNVEEEIKMKKRIWFLE